MTLNLSDWFFVDMSVWIYEAVTVNDDTVRRHCVKKASSEADWLKQKAQAYQLSIYLLLYS